MLAFVIFLAMFERNSLYENSEENLLAVGRRIVSRFDESVGTMDDTLKSLIADSDFMDAMAIQTYMKPDNRDNKVELLESANLIANVLLRNPLNQNYHRVSVFNSDGLFNSSRTSPQFETALPIERVQAIFDGLEWPKLADAAPFQYHLLTPYDDPWSQGEEIVFGLVRAVVWMGQPCGYLEVQKPVEELDEIFSPEDLNGVTVCAFLDDMQPLYESKPGCVHIAQAYFAGEDAKARASLYECDFRSPKTGLILYISQDMSIWNAALKDSISQFVLFSVMILLIAIFVILLVSRQLTQSIRVLEQAMESVCFEQAIIQPNASVLNGRNEIFRIQQAFDAVLQRLNVAIQNEMQSRDLQLQAQLNALQAQINPHFIYNTLNVITAKSLEHDALDIADVCMRFSNMLRYSTTLQNRSVTIREEIEHVTNYLELMKSRYEERLNYQIVMPDELLDEEIPKLTLQPLAENCFVHGFQTRLQQMQVVILGEKNSDGFQLLLHDNGDGFSEEMLVHINTFLKELSIDSQPHTVTFGSPKSIGLENTFTRLYLFCKGRIHFSIYNDGGATVKLTFLR